MCRGYKTEDWILPPPPLETARSWGVQWSPCCQTAARVGRTILINGMYAREARQYCWWWRWWWWPRSSPHDTRPRSRSAPSYCARVNDDELMMMAARGLQDKGRGSQRNRQSRDWLMTIRLHCPEFLPRTSDGSVGLPLPQTPCRPSCSRLDKDGEEGEMKLDHFDGYWAMI